MTDEPFVIEKLRAEPHLYLTDGEPAFFGVAVQDILDAWDSLTRERDEAREDAERLADVIRAALGAPIDIGELAGHCEGDAFFFDGYELARTRIDAALTADAEDTP
jgi:hypothetical protein